MYRTGHLGVSLLVFAPLGHLLLEADLPAVAVVVGATMCWLTMLPDVDHRLPLIRHRGPTHSLLFAVLVGGGFAALGNAAGGGLDWLSVDPSTLSQLGFVVGFVAVAAHLLGDALTPAGVPLLWPLSERRYRLSLTRADNPMTNFLLFALGAVAVAGVALQYVH